MKIVLEKQEILSAIHSALCNGGLALLSNCSVELTVCPIMYNNAKKRLLENESKSICFEDVLVEVITGGERLEFRDHESEETVSFDLEQATTNLQKLEFADTLVTYQNEQDDAYTAFELLQGALYGKVIYC